VHASLLILDCADSEVLRLQEEIEQLKGELAHEQKLKKYHEEYEDIYRKIVSLPSQQETQQ
jgi:hypothetical protein